MIALLKGEILALNAQSVILGVQGVGYEVKLSQGHLAELATASGTTVQLSTHLLNREDSLELFGFRSPQEKELFLQLTRVNGVGPRSALAIFSALDTESIIRAIIENQPKKLSQAPGIGPKTAQRIILELREKLLKAQDLLHQMPDTVEHLLPEDWREDIELTLLALGYEAHEIYSALSSYAEILKTEASAEQAIHRLLSYLSLNEN